MSTKFRSAIAEKSAFAGLGMLGAILVASAPPPVRAADVATDALPALSPPPADPYDIEGVWRSPAPAHRCPTRAPLTRQHHPDPPWSLVPL